MSERLNSFSSSQENDSGHYPVTSSLDYFEATGHFPWDKLHHASVTKPEYVSPEQLLDHIQHHITTSGSIWYAEYDSKGKLIIKLLPTPEALQLERLTSNSLLEQAHFIARVLYHYLVYPKAAYLRNPNLFGYQMAAAAQSLSRYRNHPRFVTRSLFELIPCEVITTDEGKELQFSAPPQLQSLPKANRNHLIARLKHSLR